MTYNFRQTLPNFKLFLIKAFEFLHPTKKLIDNWHLDLIIQYLDSVLDDSSTRVIFNLPPRALKSITINVAWTAWLLGIAPDQRIITISYNQELSNKHAKDCRLIMQSDWYQKIFPDTKIAKGFNKINKFCTTKGGFRLSTSPNGTLTGEGADLIIIDDPISAVDVMIAKKRQKINEWFNNALLSRLNNPATGKIILVMQRLHHDDLTGHLMQKKSWIQLVIPAISDKQETITFRNFHYTRDAKESLYDNYTLIDLCSLKNWRQLFLHNVSVMLLKVVYKPLIFSKIIHQSTQSCAIPSDKIPISLNDLQFFNEKMYTTFDRKILSITSNINQFLQCKKVELQAVPRTKETSFFKIKQEIGNRIFDIQYQQKVEKHDSYLLKQDWIHYYHDNILDIPSNFSNMMMLDTLNINSFELIYQSWDCATKAGDRNDYTVCSSWGLKNDKLYLLDITKLKVEYPKLREVVLSMADLFQVDTILIEDSAAGTQLIQEIHAINSLLKVVSIKPKLDKFTRLTLVSHLFQKGLVLLPIRAKWLEDFLNEILNFPDTVHDDQVDSVTQFLLWYQAKPKNYNYKFNIL
jgi:predicted phage terminase large subunit-like protein